SILKYSEGAQKVEVRIINENKIYNSPEFFVIHLIVDTGEAMGANIVNTMAEAVSNKVLEQIEGANLMNILSNYATESIAKANCYIHPKDLANKQITGEGVRDRIIEASQLAKVDPYRAVTHNKGIMNGVDALLVASGNDWRAVEASVHAYASKDGQYRALSQWSKTEQGYLKGELELPISLGTVGGTLSVHPTAQLAHRIMNQPSANELSRILVAVGLGQNLAALKALVTDGIQKGHMALQAQSLAITVGAKGKEIDQLTKKLENSKHMNSNTAQKLLDSIRKEG
ncbi:MAG: 3-hydroxy-3-methylglutaryl-CoA reductase, partial [Atopostipes sp.]|nr:3-hydroxy-3-methylglutaryl-CoA reductase [Atopostipes sp.]